MFRNKGIATKSVTVMVAGDSGHKLKIALDEKGINHLATAGVVQKAIRELLE